MWNFCSAVLKKKGDMTEVRDVNRSESIITIKIRVVRDHLPTPGERKTGAFVDSTPTDLFHLWRVICCLQELQMTDTGLNNAGKEGT